MREIPGVQNAAVGLTLPFERALLSAVNLSDGKEAGQEITTNQVYVTPGYFDTLQIPVLAGRTFVRFGQSGYTACRDHQPEHSHVSSCRGRTPWGGPYFSVSQPG